MKRIKVIIKNFVKWLITELKDWHTFVIFLIVSLVLSSEVWLLYLLGLILNKPVLLGIASTCWLFWLGPGTPFLSLSLFISLSIKRGMEKRKEKKEKKEEEKKKKR